MIVINHMKWKVDRGVVTPRSPVVVHGRGMVFLKNTVDCSSVFLTCQKTEPRPKIRKESVETANLVEEKTY
jgi:hypothetical protein